MSLIDFYANNKLNMLRNGYSSGFYIGIFLFALIVSIGIIRWTQSLRQQAFKAKFLEQRAYTDELTGLLNAKGFDDKCTEMLLKPDDKQTYAIVDFDVNFFSQYNATNGVAEGDRMLKRIAEMLTSFCRSDELYARQEADHFVCMLRADSFDAIINRVREADSSVRKRMTDNMLLLSYGIVEITDRTQPVASLRNHAAMAKRTVKGNYENNIAVYDKTLHELQMQEVVWLSGFEKSLENNEYVIFFQPKINLKTEKLAGAEALVRRIEADGSVISASPIIEALERKGFIKKLDYYVLELVCIFLNRCISEGLPVYPISSNFSRVHLYDTNFPVQVAQIADKYEVPHELLEIELTETAFLVENDILQNMIHQLHLNGFSVAIDDFGSGYSSLNMLKDIQVDTIKLDREFLEGFAQNARADTIIAHTLKLAQDMHITAVAEGIETTQQLEFLREHGCEIVQGYYYSKPLPEEEFVKNYLF